MKNKLTKEERAEEIRSRFEPLYDNIWGLEYEQVEKLKTLSAIELAKEALYISSNGYSAEWHNRYSYWNSILSILESKLV